MHCGRLRAADENASDKDEGRHRPRPEKRPQGRAYPILGETPCEFKSGRALIEIAVLFALAANSGRNSAAHTSQARQELPSVEHSARFGGPSEVLRNDWNSAEESSPDATAKLACLTAPNPET